MLCYVNMGQRNYKETLSFDFTNMEIYGHEESPEIEIELPPQKEKLLIMKKIDPYAPYSYRFTSKFNVSCVWVEYANMVYLISNLCFFRPQIL